MHIRTKRVQSLLPFAAGILLTCMMLIAHSPCFALMAGDGQRLNIARQRDTSYALGISTVFLNGEGKEYVYDPEVDGTKVSDLRWESEKVWLLGGHLTVQYKGWLTLNAGLWEKLSASTGTMTDDDWNAVEGLWGSKDPRFQTNFSESKSDITEASAYDLNGSISVMKFRQNNIHVRGLLGYKKETWEWEASDGYWIYIEELIEPFEQGVIGIGTAGNLEGVGIRYKHETTIPYIGVGIDFRGQRMGLEVHALYSNRVEIKATDDHLERNLRTVDSLSDGKYWSVGVNTKWHISPKLALVGAVGYEEIQTIKGESKWTFYDQDIEETIKDGAGAGYQATAFTFSMIYSF